MLVSGCLLALLLGKKARWLMWKKKTGVLFLAGDLIAQQAVERKGWRYQDWLRTTRMAAYGTFVAVTSLTFGPRQREFVILTRATGSTGHRMVSRTGKSTWHDAGQRYMGSNFCKGGSRLNGQGSGAGACGL